MSCIQFDSIDSTHLFAKRERHRFSPKDFTWISAEEQTAGQGQHGRSWYSPRGVNLYFTLYFQMPPSSSISLACIAQLMSWSVAAICLQHTLSPLFKWPNDLLFSYKKFCGVLAEIEGHDIFVSAGINVNMECALLPLMDQPITSLFLETGQLWDRPLLLQEVQIQFATDFDRFLEEGFAPFATSIHSILAYRHKTVRIIDQGVEHIGTIHTIAPDGRLCLLLPDHTQKWLSSGRIHV